MISSNIQYLRLEPADNGFLLSYSERQNKSGSPYDSCGSVDRKEIFGFQETDKCMARMLELCGMPNTEEKEESKS